MGELKLETVSLRQEASFVATVLRNYVTALSRAGVVMLITVGALLLAGLAETIRRISAEESVSSLYVD